MELRLSRQQQAKDMIGHVRQTLRICGNVLGQAASK